MKSLLPKRVKKYATQKIMKVCDPEKYESLRPKKVWKYAGHEFTFGIQMLPATGLATVS